MTSWSIRMQSSALAPQRLESCLKSTWIWASRNEETSSTEFSRG